LYFRQKNQTDSLPEGVYLHPVMLQDYICFLSPSHAVIAQTIVYSILVGELLLHEQTEAAKAVNSLQQKVTEFIVTMDSNLKKICVSLKDEPTVLCLVNDCIEILENFSISLSPDYHTKSAVATDKPDIPTVSLLVILSLPQSMAVPRDSISFSFQRPHLILPEKMSELRFPGALVYFWRINLGPCKYKERLREKEKAGDTHFWTLQQLTGKNPSCTLNLFWDDR